jgi:hypothetical protein
LCLEIFAFRRFFSEPIEEFSKCRFRSAELQHLKPQNRDRPRPRAAKVN